MQKEIVLSQDQISLLVKHAQNNIPNESCAILFVKINANQFTVKDIFLTRNVENSPIKFRLSDEDNVKLYLEADKKQFLVGIFHSHPDSEAYPSVIDQEYMELNSGPWIIFSNKNQDFKAYVFESKITQIRLTIL
ncbi:MAG: Mov34/MPN/PAD-1 family protein [Nitrosopumilaceae archaeon]